MILCRPMLEKLKRMRQDELGFWSFFCLYIGGGDFE
jgi:hypothetical protein